MSSMACCCLSTEAAAAAAAVAEAGRWQWGGCFCCVPKGLALPPSTPKQGEAGWRGGSVAVDCPAAAPSARRDGRRGRSVLLLPPSPLRCWGGDAGCRGGGVRVRSLSVGGDVCTQRLMT
jgi:hypothetical protein